MLSGSCLCGRLAYEAEAELTGIVHCHCETCRKTHGAAFSSVASVPKAAFRWVRGEEVVRSYESSPGKQRYFCGECGSHLAAGRAESANMMLRLGCLDTAATCDRQWHIWRSDGASWYDPKAEWPEFAEGMPGR
jgi:hypothetical protein